ncbi:MAG: SagB/ThcOx family dehydrogenase [Candidatus Rokubacteria bacterium]|nr:SagB/ThcOx family dehydrogenase [Candidatus Rokubacteria bacterium]
MRVARAFHDETAHSPYSIRTSGHALEWDIKPFPFKVYADLEPIALPRDFPAIPTDALPALTGPRDGAARLDLPTLASLLYHSAGVTKKKTYPGGVDVLFRAAPSTGALYQTEVYVAAGDVAGLDAGLYHFCPGDFALRRLRSGDVRGALAAAAADDTLARRAATVVLSAIYWRNTWKYQARGYRHLFWDSGTMLANLEAAGRALGLGPRIVTGFVDDAVNGLLGLDVDHEAALELVPLGAETAAALSAPTDPAIDHRVVPLSSSSVDYPRLREIHIASTLRSATDVSAWRRRPPPAPREPGHALRPLVAARDTCGRTLGDTIQRRGSTRAFSDAPLTEIELATTLWTATRPVTLDAASGLVDTYLIVNAVTGVDGGAYAYWPDAHALESIRAGAFRDRSAWLCLEQALAGDAAAVLFFVAPLDGVLAAYGNRGYRLVNLEAGIIGGRAYLAAYGQGFGASGLTFYDGHVVEFFSPHAAGKDAVFVVALGRSRVAVRSSDAVIPVESRLRRT